MGDSRAAWGRVVLALVDALAATSGLVPADRAQREAFLAGPAAVLSRSDVRRAA